MSYDLQVWSTTRPVLPDSLPKGDWYDSGSSWNYGAGSWQLVVQPTVAIETEDMPEEVRRALPGLAFLTELHLEPLSAPDSAHRMATKVASKIARSAHGVVVDDQSGTIKLPRGIKRYRAEPGKSVDLLTMSWWWTGAALTSIDAIAGFLDLVDEHVPEALPRRYGFYEPPEFKLEEEGRGHLVEFLHQAGSEFVIAYVSLPALGLTLNLQDEAGVGPHGFAAHHLRLDFDRSVLAQPGWESGLKRFWQAASLLLNPFFGDVRALRGYERNGSRLWVPPGAQDHPADGPFWAGVPLGPALAVVVGAPYLQLWQELEDTTSGEPRFLSVEDWSEDADVLASIGGVPEELADPNEAPGSTGPLPLLRGPFKYPRVWPFAPPSSGA